MQGRHSLAVAVRFWELFTAIDIAIMAFDELQMRGAAAAFERYGKGINSKSALNLADCAAYALAKTMSAPLLFKGNDFTNTDIARA
jgi:ribonuclease VapC